MNGSEESFLPVDNERDYRKHRETRLLVSALFCRIESPREYYRCLCEWKPDSSVHPRMMDWSVSPVSNIAKHLKRHQFPSMYCQDWNEHRRTTVEYVLLLGNDSKHRADDLAVARQRLDWNVQQQNSVGYPVLVDRDEWLHRSVLVHDEYSRDCSANQRVLDIAGEPSCNILQLQQSGRKNRLCSELASRATCLPCLVSSGHWLSYNTHQESLLAIVWLDDKFQSLDRSD